MKTIDLIFAKVLSEPHNLFQLIASERLSLTDGDEWTDQARIEVIKNFITAKALANPNIEDVYPDSVLHGLTSAKDAVDVFGINLNLAAVRCGGFAVFLVEREDLTDVTEEPEFALKSLVLDNITYPSQLVNCYSGRGLLYEDKDKKLATSFDFFDDFLLDNNDLSLFGLTTSYNSYLVLKSQGLPNLVDDFEFQKYIEAKGYSYNRFYA